MKLLQYFARHGITVRVVAFFTTLVIVPYLLLVCIVYAFFQSYSIDSLGQTTMDATSMVESNIASALLASQEDTMSFYHGGYVELLSRTGTLSEEDRAVLEAALAAHCFSDTRVLSAYLLTGGEVLYGGGNYPELLPLMEPFRKEIEAAGGRCLWYPTDQLRGKAGELHYVLARSLNSATEKNVGILYCILSDGMITDAYKQMTSEYASRFLTDGSGKILYASDGTAFGETLDLSAVNPNLLRSSQRARDPSGRDIILVTDKLTSVGWYCVSVIDLNEIMGSVLQLGLPFVLISLVYLAFLAVMLHILRQYVFRPLGTLTDAMDQYAQEGELEAKRIQNVGVGEIKSLSEHFNHMTQRISKLVRVYKEEVDEKNRQKMKTLAAQLTPHFIYNALNTIKWVAVLNHQENIQHLVESLVNIFMNAARSDDGNYTVQDELELIRNYAVIQKVRFMNFELTIDAQEECLDCCIRKLLFQPIVENAIVHGLNRGKVRDGNVCVKIWLENETLRATVTDQGVGFDVEAWRQKPKKDDTHTNIGVHNIEQIIQLEYGNSYGMEIVSAPGKGTTVSYTLPAVKKEPDHDTDHCSG